MRSASMAEAMLEEARRAAPDEAGRQHLRRIHERTVAELCNLLSSDLRQELSQIFVPLEEDDPGADQLRLAQAQLVGWLEGLFNGIRAAVAAESAPGMPGAAPPAVQPLPGQYL